MSEPSDDRGVDVSGVAEALTDPPGGNGTQRGSRRGLVARWAVVLVIASSLVLVGPTSFPRVSDDCAGPGTMRDDHGYCIARGTLVVLTEWNDTSARASLEAAVGNLGGFITMDSPAVGTYELTFPKAETLEELRDIQDALRRLGFRVMTAPIGELFDT